MNIWNVLGIDKTKDKEIIKSAYREKLKGVNPEDNQEGFMALRKAYEDAMYEADIIDDASDENKPEKGTLAYEFAAIYDDFNKRIDVTNWQKLFDRDEFVSLDTAEESVNQLFAFLMDNNFVPQKVYILIEETFNVRENKADFCERFPEGFINHILDNAKYRDPINYYLFDGDLKDVDKYIDIYYGLDNSITKKCARAGEINRGT
ncbi:MAG: hypothetical protein E7263_06565 [Lachnospiraceae bacterium]|nr:hypothetical protein [Lachnospiraceae bacterium]